MTPESKESSLPLIHDDAPLDDDVQDDEDQTERLEIEKLAPGNDKLRALIGSFQPPPGTFDSEEMPD
jgi:hypothetical protein